MWTYSGAVVNLFSHIHADPLQLRFSDVLHGPHHVGDGFGAVADSTTRLFEK